MSLRTGECLRLMAGVGLVVACGGDSAGPVKPGPAAAMAAVSGSGQSGAVGSALSQPVVAKVTDAKGVAVPNAIVSFSVASGNGTVVPAVDTTDASGQVQTSWTLGTNSAVEQRVTATAGALSASFTATAQPGPAAALEKVTEVGCALPGASGSRDIVVRVTDTFGNPVGQTRVDWTTGGGGTVTPGSSTTAADGRATTRWSAGADLGQSVSATVTGLPVALFSAQLATTRVLAKNQLLTLTTSDAMRCNDLAAGGGARYLLAVTNTTPALSAATFSVVGGLTTSTSTVDAPVARYDFNRSSARAVLSAEATEAHVLAEKHTRSLAGNRQIIQTMQASGGGPLRLNNSMASAAPVPNVGDTLTMRVPNLDNNSCAVPKAEIRARVVHVGLRGVLLEDVAAPLAGTMDDLYRQISNEFDTVMWPILNDHFGSPIAFDASLDANSHIFMLFTKHVNDMGAAGFVSTADFYPRSRCNISNVGEVFYAGVPLTTGTFSDPDSRDNFLRRTRTVIIHEAKHLVGYAFRFQRSAGNPTQSDLEDTWLEEATAMLAEELWARTVFGFAQRANTIYRNSLYCEVRPDWPECAPNPKPRAMFDHFGFLYEYEQEIERLSPLGQVDGNDFTWYGSAWALLRWTLDHTTQTEAAFLRTLTEETAIHGVQNLQARSGRDFGDLITDWTLALALDDRVGFTSPRAELTIPSWNVPDIFNGFFTDFGNQGVVARPMAVRNVSFGNFTANVNQLRGGSMAIFELSGTQVGRQLLELRGTFTNLRLTLVRID